MKSLFKKFVAVSLLGFALMGCERGLSEREKECYELTGDSSCIGKAGNRMAGAGYNSANLQYGPTAPGNYQNYYGSPQHGYWSQGRYMFNDPYSSYATSTNSFLVGAGVGGLAAYMLTKNSNRSSWNTANPRGYTQKIHKQTTYVSKNNKPISKAEFKKRAAQSKKAKAAHKSKLAAKKQKAKQQKAKQQKAKQQKAKQQKAKQQKAKQQKAKQQKAKQQKAPLNFNKAKPKSNYRKPTSSYSKPRAKPKQRAKSKPRSSTKKRR